MNIPIPEIVVAETSFRKIDPLISFVKKKFQQKKLHRFPKRIKIDKSANV